MFTLTAGVPSSFAFSDIPLRVIFTLSGSLVIPQSSHMSDGSAPNIRIPSHLTSVGSRLRRDQEPQGQRNGSNARSFGSSTIEGSRTLSIRPAVHTRSQDEALVHTD